MQSPYPGLRQWAFDTLSIPTMSAEMERLFSHARRMITVDRNRLKIEQLEAAPCMKHWLDVGIPSTEQRYSEDAILLWEGLAVTC